MAVYEYLCRDCEAPFEVRRAMGDADSDVTCPSGHTDVRRKLSMFASVGAMGAAPGTMRAGPVPPVGVAAAPVGAGTELVPEERSLGSYPPRVELAMSVHLAQFGPLQLSVGGDREGTGWYDDDLRGGDPDGVSNGGTGPSW